MPHTLSMTLQVDIRGLYFTGARREAHFISQVHTAIRSVRDAFGSQASTPGDVMVTVIDSEAADPGGSSDLSHVSPDTSAPDPSNHSVDHPVTGVRPGDVLAHAPETGDPVDARMAQLEEARDAGATPE